MGNRQATGADSVASEAPHARAALDRAIAGAGGWLPFDDFMALALYAPGWGYYAGGGGAIGAGPADGSDFATAPVISPLFGQALALALGEALSQTGTHGLWEFGAGTGALAAQLIGALDAAGRPLRQYTIVELSGALRARQQQALARFGDRVRWVDALPGRIEGVVVGNEVLDAMPVKLLVRLGGRWHERGVVPGADGALTWADRPTALRPPVEPTGGHDYLTEIHPQAEAFIRTLGERLVRGAAFFIDYGFPEAEYYHPERHMGTLMTHRAHRAGTDPLAAPGQQDITAHVNFTGIALAAQVAGLSVLGYTAQGRFLLNSGIAPLMQAAPLAQRAAAHRLLAEHEMGELFKVIGLAAGEPWAACGFAEGDRSHRL